MAPRSVEKPLSRPTTRCPRSRRRATRAAPRYPTPTTSAATSGGRGDQRRGLGAVGADDLRQPRAEGDVGLPTEVAPDERRVLDVAQDLAGPRARILRRPEV